VTGLVVVASVACNDEAGAACTTDRDCATGLICRDRTCGSPRPDAGLDDASPAFDSTAACTSDGVFCNQPTECCSNLCTNNVCGAVPGGTQTCRQQLETCLTPSDCCSPFQCSKGLCR
jgi:hypothetical protein